MIAPDTLRPPAPLDPTAAAYKDWLHLNLFDHAAPSIGLVNCSLHGAPADPRSLAVGVALVWRRGDGWRGNVAVRSMSDASVGLAHIALDRVALAVDHLAGRVHASADFPDDGLALKLESGAVSSAVDIDRMLPLGPGWISWYAVPLLTLTAEVTIDGERRKVADATSYHDHCWGRWYWGQDFGWEWGTFQAPSPGPTFVFARVTDRAHEHAGRTHLTVHIGTRTLRFPSATVSVEHDAATFDGLVRLPGAQAALQQDRRRPMLPRRLRIAAKHEQQRITLEFEAWAAAQLITADPARRGYGFIHEIAGRFGYEGRLGDETASGSGLAVVEHVD